MSRGMNAAVLYGLRRAGRLGDGWIEGYQPHNSVTCDEGVEQ